MNSVLMFVMILTVFQPGRGPVTLQSDPMTLEACRSALDVATIAAGDRIISGKCELSEAKK